MKVMIFNEDTTLFEGELSTAPVQGELVFAVDPMMKGGPDEFALFPHKVIERYWYVHEGGALVCKVAVSQPSLTGTNFIG